MHVYVCNSDDGFCFFFLLCCCLVSAECLVCGTTLQTYTRPYKLERVCERVYVSCGVSIVVVVDVLTVHIVVVAAVVVCVLC